MQLSSLLGHTRELLLLIRQSNKPADSLIDSFFRSHKYLGSHDRRFIAETTYGTLRHLSKCETLTRIALASDGDGIPTNHLLSLSPLAYLARVAGTADLNVAAAMPFIESVLSKGAADGFFQRLSGAQLPSSAPMESVALEYSFPEWMVQRLARQYGADETRRICDSMNNPAPLTLRVNTLKSTVDACMERLASEGIRTDRTPHSPVGLTVSRRTNIFRLPAFREGLFEVQDEGSQLVAALVDPHPTWKVLDACAGAGGKSLHLSALMENRGEIVATDINEFRLGQLRKRARRAGAFNIRVMSPEQLQESSRLFDAVFLDAPCSGLGTLRRNPGLKWTVTENDVQELRGRQAAILEQYSPYVKPDGTMFYATCSLLEEENEDIIREFLVRHPEFSPLDLSHHAEKIGLSNVVTEGCLSLYPHRQGTDAFFCGAVRKVRVMGQP